NRRTVEALPIKSPTQGVAVGRPVRYQLNRPLRTFQSFVEVVVILREEISKIVKRLGIVRVACNSLAELVDSRFVVTRDLSDIPKPHARRYIAAVGIQHSFETLSGVPQFAFQGIQL